MASPNSITHNAGEYVIRGQVDLSAGAAVVATRGDNLVTVKAATGSYNVTMKGVNAVRLVEILDGRANFMGTVPATALGVRVNTVTQTAGTDDVVINLRTMALPTSGADTDTTAATTVSFQVVIRTLKMGAQL